MVVAYHNKWTAVAGIPLTTKPGTIYLTEDTSKGIKNPHSYSTERLS